MRRLTASRFGLAVSCVYPWTSGLEWDESSSYSASLGKAFHSFAEFGGRKSVDELVKRYELTPALNRRLSKMASLWLDWWEPRKEEPVTLETKMALDPLTGHAELLHAAGERNYSGAPPNWITGTADIIHVRARAVTDYKTGAFLEHPGTNGQMRLLSLMVARIYGWDEVESRMEIFEERSHQTQKALHSLPVLQQTESEVFDVTQRIANNHGPTPGNHCFYKFCPIRTKCDVAWKRP